MHAVVSLLDINHIQQVEELWQCLEKNCGLSGIRLTPYAHFSWHVAQNYTRPGIEEALIQVSNQALPFKVRCAGFGIFSGPSPVLHINLVKTVAMAEFHSALCAHIEPLAVGPSEHYRPNQWVPHITLAHSDLTSEKLSCAVEELGYLPLDWEIQVDNLALVYQIGKEVGQLVGHYPFLGAEHP